MKTVLTYFSCVLVCLSLSAQTKPNFVVILADDLGWMDINSNAEYLTGTKPNEQFYETPHISALAEEGVSFSRCYSGPLCTPSRAKRSTSSSSVMAIKQLQIGAVPDRGGRVNEMRPSKADLMPKWTARSRSSSSRHRGNNNHGKGNNRKHNNNRNNTGKDRERGKLNCSISCLQNLLLYTCSHL